MKNNLTRRDFNQKISSAIISYALIDSLFATDAIGKPIEPIVQHWSKRLNEMCQDLKLEKISQRQWQTQIEALFRQVEMNELLKFIDFEKLIKGFQYPDLGVNVKYVKFPKLDGIPQKTVFLKKIFGMKKNRAIIPHGHSNMSSAHLVLKGSFALKHYDKVKEENNHLIIKPTIDKKISIGDASSISDSHNNIHWFIADSDVAFTFDVIMLDLNKKHYDIHNIDINAGEKIANNLIRAKKLDVETALKKYGKHSHH